MKRLALHACLLMLLAGAGMASSGVRLSFFKAEKQESDIVISWQSAEEAGLAWYALERRSALSRDEWVFVADRVTPRGAAKPYTYRDGAVYKSATEQVDYRLWAVYADGTRQEFGPIHVNYTPTSVRRTWGSIKAMFQ